jgi:hypothetical protein
MTPNRLDALLVVSALTFAFGVLSHLLVEAIVSGGRLELVTLSHVLMSIAAPAALAWSIARIGGFRHDAERRRRVALVRSSLRAHRPHFFAGVSLAQAAIAGGILRLEDIAVAPGQLLTMLLSIVVAVVAGTLVLAAAQRRIRVLLASWLAREVPVAAQARTRVAPFQPRPSAAIPLVRSCPDRAPPLLLSA